MTQIPKAALYYSPTSVWSAVARLAIEEKGYGKDELDLRIVDLGKGENYNPTYLRLNPQATVPVLVVPYENSLTDGVESRYKALVDTTPIVEFLDKSRSALSHTHTTSTAPAPALTPATIEATTLARSIIDLLHAERANPNTLRYVNARDDKSLRVLAHELLPSMQDRSHTLSDYLAQAGNGSLRVSEKVKKLWMDKLDAINVILAVFAEADKPESELSDQAKAHRVAFFKTARQAWETNLTEVLTQLSKEMVGPYTLGDQMSIADLHLAGWLTRVVKLAGGSASDDGSAVAKKLEEHIGGGFVLPKDFATEQARRENTKAEKQTKIGAFWNAMGERESWKKVYGDGLF
ncbi:hypothetical protein CPC08DRAFT_739654 [Agrocybe pediades]|nr:hypothetical protein CPC08DRAFT_739654 [Agrocybe pediades]